MDVHSGRPTPVVHRRHALDARLCTTQPTVRLNNVPGQNHSARVRFATTAQTEGSVMRTRPADSADYVVVGAGSAGSIVASRLAASCASVVVLEAGGTDRRPDVAMAIGRASIYRQANWLYPCTPDSSKNGFTDTFVPGRISPTLGPSRTEPVDRSRCPGARIVAGQAVVLCAGAIGTPAILLRSGVGPCGSVADVPAVGENFQDHLVALDTWRSKVPTSSTLGPRELRVVGTESLSVVNASVSRLFLRVTQKLQR